jgi:outer membrane lipoprotein-sorting protein
MRMLFTILLSVCSLYYCAAEPTDVTGLYSELKQKVLSVTDYTADVRMKVDVSFMRVPLLAGTLYYKYPDKMKLERNGGIAVLPKKNNNLSLSSLIPVGEVTVIDAGTGTLDGTPVRILKVIPDDDATEIVLTRLWVDEKKKLVLKTETTTHNDGTILMSLSYGKYAKYSLPDKVTVFMDLKEYKLPKGVTMDYMEEPTTKSKKDPAKQGKGTIEINYLSYKINTGLPDSIFKKG